MQGQSAPSATFSLTDSNIGGELLYSRYTLGGMWNAGIRATDYLLSTTSDYDLEALQLTATASYMQRVASTRSRRLNLNLGGGMFVGYEFLDPFGSLPEYIETDLDDGQMVFGVIARSEIEFFITRQLAVIGAASIPLSFRSNAGWFHWEAGIGIRFNI